MNASSRSGWLLGIVALVLAAGCWSLVPEVDPAVKLEHQQRFKMASLPSDPAEGVQTLRAVLAVSPTPGGEVPVVVTGCVGGMPNPYGDLEPGFPWREGQASFFLVDTKTAAEFADHQHASPDHQCAFCAREAKMKLGSVALVEFRQAKGGTIPVAARPLFDLVERQTVTVRGKAKLVGDLLVVTAEGYYPGAVEQPAAATTAAK